MLIKMFKSKIHRARITQCDLNYEGSITIDGLLLDEANIREYEAVWIWNINNGERLMTYALRGTNGSGCIGLNGAAARMAQVNDLVIITAFTDIDDEELEKCDFKPNVVFVDQNNNLKEIKSYSGNDDLIATPEKIE